MTLRQHRRHPHPHVARDVTPAALPDLLDGTPRGCLAWATETGPAVTPSTVRFPADFDGLDSGQPTATLKIEAGGPLPDRPCEAVALVDRGVWWYGLRAVYARGSLDDGELTPTRVTAWDYGQLRETDDAPR